MKKYDLRSNAIYAIIGGVAIGVLGLARTFWVARALSPIDFGEWSILQLILVYAGLCHLGAAVAMPNEIVAKEALNNLDGSRILARGGLVLILGSSALFSIACLILPKGLIGDTLANYRLLFAVTFFSQQLFLHVSALLRGHMEFKLIALGQTIFGIGSLALMGLLLPTLGVRGALISLLLANVVATSIGFRWLLYYGWTLRVSKTTLTFLFLAGLPLFISALVGTALQNVDRVIIGRYLGKESLGYYSVSNLFIMPVMFLPSVLGGLLMTHFSRAAVVEKKSTIRNHLQRFSWGVAVALSVVTLCIYLMCEPVITQYIPKYKLALSTVRILMVATYFYASTIVLANFLIANKYQSLLLIIQGGSMLLLGLTCYAAVKLNLGFQGVGWANFCCYVVYFALMLSATCKAMNWSWRFFSHLMVAFILPILFMSIVYLVLMPLKSKWASLGLLSPWFLLHLAVLFCAGVLMALLVYRSSLRVSTTGDASL